MIVESSARQQSDIKQLDATIDKSEQTLKKQLSQLCRQDFQCEPDAMQAAEGFDQKLKYHRLETIEVVQQTHHAQPGRPRKQANKSVSYQIRANLVRNQTATS